MSYYSVDTDRYQDIRIKRLKKGMGCKGIAVYDYILCETYRVRGCYLEWDENTAFDVADYFGLDENLVKEIVKYCAAVGLFSKELLQRGIITSLSIQRRYVEMCARTKRKITIPECCVLPDSPPIKETCDEFPALNLESEIKLLKNEGIWLDQLQVLHSMSVAELHRCLDDFKAQCVADGKEGHLSLQDAKSHFNSWLRIIKNKNQKNNASDRSSKSNKRRGVILSTDEKKTYGDTF